jgi:hypothetical protein
LSYSFAPLGVIGGQTVRVNVSNPRDYPPDPCVVVVYDAEGKVVAESPTFLLPAVQKTAFFDFPYSTLGASAANAARAEVRAVLKIQTSRDEPPDPCISTELVDQASGGTLVVVPSGILQLPAVQ